MPVGSRHEEGGDRHHAKPAFALLLALSIAFFGAACGEDAPPGDGGDSSFDLGGNTDVSDDGEEDPSDTGADTVDLGDDSGGSDDPVEDTPVEDAPVDVDTGVDTSTEDVPTDVLDADVIADTGHDLPPDLTDADVDGGGDDLAGDVSDVSDVDGAGDASDAREMDADIPPTPVFLEWGTFTLEAPPRDTGTLEVLMTNPVPVDGFRFTTTGIEWDLGEVIVKKDGEEEGAAGAAGFRFSTDYTTNTITGYTLTPTTILGETDEPVVLLVVRFEEPPTVDETCLVDLVINEKGGDVALSEAGPCYCFTGSCDE